MLRRPAVESVSLLLVVFMLLSVCVHAQPVFTLTKTDATCGKNNGVITVNVTSGTPNYIYQMDGAGFQIMPTFMNVAPGPHTITVEDGSPPPNNISVQTITIAGQPGPTLVSVDTIQADCNGNGAIITINATGGTSPLQYSIDGINFGNSNVFTSAPVGPFTAYVQDANTCQDTKANEIFKRCLQLIAGGTDPTCANNDGTINAIASGGFQPYQFSRDTGKTWQSTGNFTGVPAGQYLINVVDDRGQASSYLVTLTLNCFQATAATTDATCGQSNGAIDITAVNGYAPYHYSIDNGANFQLSPHFGSLTAKAYPDIVVNDDRGNTIHLSATVNASAALTINVTPTAATCVNNDGALAVTGSGAGPYLYALDGGKDTAVGNFINLTSGAHTITVKDPAGCTATQSVTVPLNNNLTVNGGLDVHVCPGRTGVLQATSNGTSFSWAPATGLSDPSILQPTVTPTGNATYTLTATLGICQKTATTNVILNSAPVAVAGPGANICSGQSTQLHGSGGVTYAWTPAASLVDPTAAEPFTQPLTETTTFHLTVTDGAGCQSQNDAFTTVTITQPPRVFAGNDTTIQQGQSVVLHGVDVDNVGLGGWVWTPNDYLDNDVTQNPVSTPTQSITYTLRARTFNGCEGLAKVTVNVYSAAGIFVPTAFTPNGDGRNDVFRPVMVGMKELKYFAVFDRWGQRVFYSTNPTDGWRGTVNGKEQPTGTYVWMAAAVDIQGHLIQQKGTVLLIR